MALVAICGDADDADRGRGSAHASSLRAGADGGSSAAPVVSEQNAAGTIEVVLPDGLRLRVGNDVGLAALRRVMTVLRG